MELKLNKIAFINNTDRKVSFDFEYEELLDVDVNINNVCKSDLNNKYDFII